MRKKQKQELEVELDKLFAEIGVIWGRANVTGYVPVRIHELNRQVKLLKTELKQ